MPKVPPGLGTLPGGLEALGIGIHQHLEHPLGMEAGGPAPFGLGEPRVPFDLRKGAIDHAHEVVLRDEFVQPGRQQTGLIQLVRFESDLMVFAAHAAP